MNCFNPLSGNDQRVICKRTYHKNYYAKNRERILAQQKRYRTENVEILKTRRKRWYEINKERLASTQSAYCQQNKEHIRNYRRQYCKKTGNGSTNIGDVIMRRIKNESGKDFGTKSKEKQTKISCVLEQESEKLETSLVPTTNHGQDF